MSLFCKWMEVKLGRVISQISVLYQNESDSWTLFSIQNWNCVESKWLILIRLSMTWKLSLFCTEWGFCYRVVYVMLADSSQTWPVLLKQVLLLFTGALCQSSCRIGTVKLCLLMHVCLWRYEVCPQLTSSWLTEFLTNFPAVCYKCQICI